MQLNEDNNPYNLEVGKQYWFQYTGCESEWFCGIVTRFTQFGHPWVEATDKSKYNGIISPGLYKVQHVSLNPLTEEKMYTKDVFINSLWKFAEYIRNEDVGLDYSTAKDWFEQNIK